MKILFGKYKKSIFKYLRTNFSTTHLLNSYSKIIKMINEINDCDVVISQGWSMLIPHMLGIPHIVIPYGTEIWEASSRPDFMEPLRFAYKIGSPSALFENSLKNINLENRFPLHIPLDTTTYRPTSINHDLFPFQEKFDKNFIFFMPARIHFEYKGTEKVIEAFSRISKLYQNVLLVLLDWGDDKIHVRNMIKELGITNKVIILDYWFSEKSLNLLFNLADVVLDQFSSTNFGLGTLTGIGRGAALAGRPIITSYFYDDNSFVDTEPMPVFSANSIDEIFNSMKFCIENKEEITLRGKKNREWMLKYHGEKALNDLVELLKNAIAVK